MPVNEKNFLGVICKIQQLKKDVELNQLPSLLYLIDKKSFIDCASKITDDVFINTKCGPANLVAYLIFNSLIGVKHFQKVKEYFAVDDENKIFQTNPIPDTFLDYLSDYDDEIIEKIVSKFSSLDCKNLPEWKNPALEIFETFNEESILKNEGFNEEFIKNHMALYLEVKHIRSIAEAE